jgi:predicted metal-dependent RNase
MLGWVGEKKLMKQVEKNVRERVIQRAAEKKAKKVKETEKNIKYLPEETQQTFNDMRSNGEFWRELSKGDIIQFRNGDQKITVNIEDISSSEKASELCGIKRTFHGTSSIEYLG